MTTLDKKPRGKPMTKKEDTEGEEVALKNLSTEHDSSSLPMKTRGMVAPATPMITVSRGVNQLRFQNSRCAL